MWSKEYQDYPTDTPLNKMQVAPGRGIIGCEMHERMGWGTTLHISPGSQKATYWKRFLRWILGVPKAKFPPVKPVSEIHDGPST
jgi:hypothetical protein